MLEAQRRLTEKLSEAARAYYQEDYEIMSNKEYDKLYSDLERMEKESGIILASSPTVKVGYDILSDLEKKGHVRPMLSLDKTKDILEFKDFVGERKTLISWKLDGLTVVLTYKNGALKEALTRGDGHTGEVVTNNALTFKNLPLQIPYKGELVLRGEAVISYSDFEKINEKISDPNEKYRNPRNLCSGSVRHLDSKVAAKRNIQFIAFELISVKDRSFGNSHAKELAWLSEQGFDVVESFLVDEKNDHNFDSVMEFFREAIDRGVNDIPSDGLVALYDDISYGQSLGATAKFPKNALAFKWKDDVVETKIIRIEWRPSRTGTINPVAIFEPVEIDGSIVSKASLHNVKIVRDLQLSEGDTVEVYKANMVIPQIARNLTKRGPISIPRVCPACLEPTVLSIGTKNGIDVLYCTNPECPAKKIKVFSHFVSRNGMNIEGLSEVTLERILADGLVNKPSDIFRLTKYDYPKRLERMEGFGKKSAENLVKSIEKASVTTLPNVLYALGIPGVGKANANAICEWFENDIRAIMNATKEELVDVDGVGKTVAENIWRYFQDEKNCKELDTLLLYLAIK